MCCSKLHHVLVERSCLILVGRLAQPPSVLNFRQVGRRAKARVRTTGAVRVFGGKRIFGHFCAFEEIESNSPKRNLIRQRSERISVTLSGQIVDREKSIRYAPLGCKTSERGSIVLKGRRMGRRRETGSHRPREGRGCY